MLARATTAASAAVMQMMMPRHCWQSVSPGIDVKYSTGTKEWFDNELPLCDTCYLQSKAFLPWQKQ
jgi:hypothetical protein